MNDILSAIESEYSALQSGLSALLQRMQSVNGRLREASAHVETLARTIETVAPPSVVAPLILSEAPPIASLDGSHELNGHAKASEVVQEGRSEGEEGEGSLDGAGERQERSKRIPRTWEHVRKLKGRRLDEVEDTLGLPRGEGGHGSAMRRQARIWREVQSIARHEQ